MMKMLKTKRKMSKLLIPKVTKVKSMRTFQEQMRMMTTIQLMRIVQTREEM